MKWKTEQRKKINKTKSHSFKWPIKLINFHIDQEKNGGKTQTNNIWPEIKRQYDRCDRH